MPDPTPADEPRHAHDGTSLTACGVPLDRVARSVRVTGDTAWERSHAAHAAGVDCSACVDAYEQDVADAGLSRPRTLGGAPLLWPREQGDPQPRHDACPDGGTCRDDCRTVCRRTQMAGPLSGWLREQGLDPSDPQQGWPVGTDVRPKDRRPALPSRPEFCHHDKGEQGATVPPCLRTLDDEGRCSVHGDDVFGLGQRVRHRTLGAGYLDSDERLDGQVRVTFDTPVPVLDGTVTADAVWCNPHNLSPEEPSRA